MADNATFRDLMRRARGGDSQAAAELVRQYEPTIRLVVRRRLRSPALRRRLDSMDICQSVLASFFVRAACGQYEVDTPSQLVALLTKMARYKLGHQIRKHHAARRDCRRHPEGGLDPAQLTAPGPSPSEQAAVDDLVTMVRSRLSAEEVWVADQRALGRTWVEIAAEIGDTPDGLRIRFTRAMDRVSRELGLES